MILKVTNNSGGTVADVVDGGSMYISFTSVIVNASNVITHYKTDNGGSFVAVPSGHVALAGELPSNNATSFNKTLSS